MSGLEYILHNVGCSGTRSYPILASYYFCIRMKRKGNRQFVQFLKIDKDGIEQVIYETWKREFPEQLKFQTEAFIRLGFYTADKCDDNRGRSWNRKAA